MVNDGNLTPLEATSLGSVLLRKNLSSEKFSDKFRKFNNHEFYMKIRNFFRQVF
jgi:hypothetical protein